MMKLLALASSLGLVLCLSMGLADARFGNHFSISANSHAEAKEITRVMDPFFECIEYVPALGVVRDCR